MGDAEFNTLAFEKKLFQLKDTQESIQSLSAWCLKQRAHHKKIVSTWLSVLKRVKTEQRLTLFYLANDVIQYSKRKNYEFVESWGLNLQKATPLVRDEKVKHKILRIFKIWEQRSVYDEEFLSDLTGLLSAGAIKKSADDDTIDFQPQQLVNKIRQCAVLEAETDLRLKYIHESHLELSDADALCASLKDRRNKDDVEKELNEGAACVERYTEALQKEIVVREQLLELLNSASQYYSTQRGEVKVVAYAYKTFGARVRALKRKLDELIPQLPNAAPSPPERDEDVPSPGPDEDLDLPPAGDISGEEVSYNIDKTFNTSLTADGALYNLGLSSFLGTDNPLSLFNETNSQGSTDNTGKKIEVINNRPSEKQDFNINDFLKNLIPVNDTSTSDNNSVVSVALSQKSQDALPGLDLLVSESSSNPPPPTSFYGSINSTVQDETEHYGETNNQWSNPSWNLPPLVTPSLPVPTMVPPVPPPLSSTHKPITPNLTAITPTLSSITPNLAPITPITPTHAQIAPTLNPLTSTHPPLAPAHAPITPARVTITPTHAAITPTYAPITPSHAPINTTHVPITPTNAPITPTHAPITPTHAPITPTPLSLETPESPPPASAPLAPPPVVPSTRMFARDLPPSDVDHRGLLPPPPPPPPLLPNLRVLEDIDHRMLPSLNAPPAATSTPVRNAATHKDVDHRNLIPLTHQVSDQTQLLRGTDQDYRVPPPTTNPSDIVESVDMELSEDEEQSMQQLVYPNQIVQNASQQHTPYNQSTQNYKQDDQRRQNFTQNNKLLTGVGRNNVKDTGERHNLIRINSFPSENNSYDKQDKQLPPEPVSAPAHAQQSFQYHNTTDGYAQNYPDGSSNAFDSIEEAVKSMDDNNSNDSAYGDDPQRHRYEMVRNPSPPEVHWTSSDGDWMQNRGAYMNQMNPRFQRNWNPVMRNSFRPPGFPHFWPRNGPRPPNRPWLGPRPPRGHW